MPIDRTFTPTCEESLSKTNSSRQSSNIDFDQKISCKKIGPASKEKKFDSQWDMPSGSNCDQY